MLVSVLIPAYQEAATVAELLKRVLASDVGSLGFTREILICDDGSTDGTREAIERAAQGRPEVKVFSHAQNRGKGASIRTLLEQARGEVVLIQDADLEYAPEDCLALLERFRNGHDAVYGSRFLVQRRPEGMRLLHWVANRVLTAMANTLYGIRISDEATCSKLIRTSLLRDMALECQGFEFCPEVTAKLALMGVPIAEVPVSYQARDIQGGKKVRFRDGLVAMVVLTQLRWNRSTILRKISEAKVAAPRGEAGQ
jgi:hypothetical protein